MHIAERKRQNLAMLKGLIPPLIEKKELRTTKDITDYIIRICGVNKQTAGRYLYELAFHGVNIPKEDG
jgi:hypothetical protein